MVRRPEADMDSSISFKPSPAATGKTMSGRDPVTVREAVETDLDRAKTVSPAGDGSSRQHDHKSDQQRGDQRGADHPPADLIANPESRDVLYRERDVRAEARPQLEQALLRQRAYHPAPPLQPDAEAPAAPDPHADIKA